MVCIKKLDYFVRSNSPKCSAMCLAENVSYACTLCFFWRGWKYNSSRYLRCHQMGVGGAETLTSIISPRPLPLFIFKKYFDRFRAFWLLFCANFSDTILLKPPVSSSPTRIVRCHPPHPPPNPVWRHPPPTPTVKFLVTLMVAKWCCPFIFWVSSML